MSQPLTDKQQYWSDQLQRAQDSGLSIVEYAKANDIPAQKLYQWRNTLKSTKTTVKQETRFTRVITGNTAPSGLQIQLPGARLQFSELPDASWLAQLLTKTTSAQ